MNSKTYRQLTVYKASAGSGKTFTLALEYIKLLIINPSSFRNILAVTFTNKATDEMKSRILYFLYGLASDLKDSDIITFRNLLKNELGFDDKKINTNARRAMYLLIHNYTYFNIETIDSFFQRVLRNMAKELGLTAGIRLELNDKQVGDMAVDRLVDSMDKDSDLLSWITKFIFDNIDEDKSWNVIKDVKDFGKNIFYNETYHRNRDRLNILMTAEGGKYRDNFIKDIQGLRNNIKHDLESIKKEYDEAIIANGIDESIFSRGLIPKYFAKFTNDSPAGLYSYAKDTGTINKFLDDTPDKYINCVLKKEQQANAAFVENVLADIIRKSVDTAYNAERIFNNVTLTLKNFYKLALLNRIEKEVKQINSEKNSFLLSDTQNLLSEFVNEDDAPFIYEKTGSFLEHIMIDEFQDTATNQWRNFKILIDNCMANSSNESKAINNMLVGDVKQSIYRWRQGDWSILNDMKSTKTIDVTSLDTNYRSQETIIDFNNRFFKFAAENEKRNQDTFREGLSRKYEGLIPTEKLTTAYSDVCQKVNKKGNGGYVRISLINVDSDNKGKDNIKEESEDYEIMDYDEHTLKIIENEINELLDHGAQQKDIAILLRYNKYIPQIAEYFSKNERIKIVSDEAFRLDSSLSVNIIISVLRLMVNPDDNVSKAFLVKSYNEEVLKSDEHIDDYTSDCYLPDNFTVRMKEISAMPVTDMLEDIYKMFDLEKIENQDAFICALYDNINDFVNDNSADIESFLEEWDNNLRQKTIQGSSSDGIRIMSYHKSKGLEFENVILPYCDWQLVMRPDNLLWCEPKEKEFEKLPVVPVTCIKEIQNSMYTPDYIDEVMQNAVDDLNLLYVAFTRAGRNLFIIGKDSKKPSRSTVIKQFIEGKGNEENDVITYEEGNLTDIVHKIEKKEISQNKFKQQYQPLPIKILPGSNKAEFRQSNASRDFMSDGEEDVRTECLDRGKVLHRMMASIATAEDTDRVISEFRNNGLIDDAEDIKASLHKMLNHNMISSWFDGSWKLFNECEILMPDKGGRLITFRPDRVMMKGEDIIVADYKTGNEYASYNDQVSHYMEILKTMYPDKNIKGYLLYLDKVKVVEVK